MKSLTLLPKSEAKCIQLKIICKKKVKLMVKNAWVNRSRWNSLTLAVIAIYRSKISSTKTGRKAIRMIDDTDKFGGGRPGSYYVLY